MVRQSSRAVKGRGGKWFRLPRPKPETQPHIPNDNPTEGEKEQEGVGYDSCDDEGFTAVVVKAAQMSAQVLDDAGQCDAAANVHEVCRQLLFYKGAHEELKVRCDEMHTNVKTAVCERRVAQRKMQNAQGKGSRYW